MDIEKAKELLNLCPICDANKEGCNCERRNAYVWVFEQLEEFEEKEKAKKPMRYYNGLWYSFECPRCSAKLYMVENFPRCECGQKIDWGEFGKDIDVPSKGENDDNRIYIGRT